MAVSGLMGGLAPIKEEKTDERSGGVDSRSSSLSSMVGSARSSFTGRSFAASRGSGMSLALGSLSLEEEGDEEASITDELPSEKSFGSIKVPVSDTVFRDPCARAEKLLGKHSGVFISLDPEKSGKLVSTCVALLTTPEVQANDKLYASVQKLADNSLAAFLIGSAVNEYSNRLDEKAPAGENELRKRDMMTKARALLSRLQRADLPHLTSGEVVGAGATSVGVARAAEKRDVIVKGEYLTSPVNISEIIGLIALEGVSGATRLEAVQYDRSTGYLNIVLSDAGSPITKGSMSEAEAFITAHRLSGVLSTLHAFGLVHADVKGGNICKKGDMLSLIDLGSTRVEGAVQRSGVTFSFCPPEFFAEGGASSKEMDLWALGIVLFDQLSSESFANTVLENELEFMEIAGTYEILDQCDMDEAIDELKTSERMKGMLKRLLKMDPKERSL